MFHLTRYYSIASIIGIGVIAVALSMYFRHIAEDILIAQQTNANVDLTHSYANALWDEFAEFVERSESWSSGELRETLI